MSLRMRVAPAQVRAHQRRRSARRARRSSRTGRGSRRPGDSSTASPGCASAIARATAASSVPRISTGARRARERARDARRVAADQQHGAAVRVDDGLQRREVLALAVAAGDQHDRPAEALERGLRRGDRRALRVVDVEHAARLARSRCIRCGRPSKRVSAREHAARRSCATDGHERQRRQRVQRVVAADAAPGRRPAASSAPPRASHVAAVAAAHEAPLVLRRPARWRRTSRPCGPGSRIASERGSSRFSTCTPPPREDARLGRGVVVDAGVAVEVVVGDVEHGGRDRRQRRRRLELEARQLEHEHVGPRRPRVRRDALAARRARRRRCCRRRSSTSPAARHSAPVSAVTVVLPLEPVIASTFCSGGSARANSSMSPTSSAPRATAAAIAGCVLGARRG